MKLVASSSQEPNRQDFNEIQESGDMLDYEKMLKARGKEEKPSVNLEGEVRSEFAEIVGASPAWKATLNLVSVVARTDSSVLILGETGTGKELIARAIHKLNDRRERPFVKLNCAAIPLGLLESELFGHEKGAFTGAIAQKTGRFELAHRGTLFLDEVGDIPLVLQAKMLRVLQEQEFERLGGNHTLKVDVRLIAATHRDLASMVRQGHFGRTFIIARKCFQSTCRLFGNEERIFRNWFGTLQSSTRDGWTRESSKFRERPWIP